MGNVSESRRTHWDRIHGGSDPEAQSWFQSEPATSLRLIERCGVGPQARILDVGGGTSVLVDRLLDRQRAGIGVLDISARAIAQAQHRLGRERSARVEWYVEDVTRFDSPHPWDVWHDRAVFHFLVEASDRNRYREVLERSVGPGGQVIVATFSPTGPDRCSGLPTVRYSPDRLGAELGEAFQLVESHPESHTTPAGRVQDFVYCRFVHRTGRAGTSSRS